MAAAAFSSLSSFGSAVLGISGLSISTTTGQDQNPILGSNARWRGVVRLEVVHYDGNSSVQIGAFKGYCLAHTRFTGAAPQGFEKRDLFVVNEVNSDYATVQILYDSTNGKDQQARVVQEKIVLGLYSNHAKIPAALSLLQKKGIGPEVTDAAFGVLEENNALLTAEDFHELWKNLANHQKLEGLFLKYKNDHKLVLKLLAGAYLLENRSFPPLKTVEKIVEIKKSQLMLKDFHPVLLTYIFIEQKNEPRLFHTKFMLALQVVLEPNKYELSIVEASNKVVNETVALPEQDFVLLDRKTILSIVFKALEQSKGQELIVQLEKVLTNILDDKTIPTALKYSFSILLMRIDYKRLADLKDKCVSYVLLQPNRITFNHRIMVEAVKEQQLKQSRGMREIPFPITHPFLWGRLDLLQVLPSQEHQSEFREFQKQHTAYRGSEQLFFKKNDPLISCSDKETLLEVNLEGDLQPAHNWSTRALENSELPEEARVAAAIHLLARGEDEFIQSALNFLKAHEKTLQKGFVELCQKVLDKQNPLQGLPLIFDRDVQGNQDYLALKFQLAVLISRHSEDLPESIVEPANAFLLSLKGTDLPWIGEKDLIRMTEMFVEAEGLDRKLQALTSIVYCTAPKLAELLANDEIDNKVRLNFAICLLQFKWRSEAEPLKSKAVKLLPVDTKSLSSSQNQIITNFNAHNLLPTAEEEWEEVT